MSRVTIKEWYQRVNAVYPDPLPAAPTAEEAVRAARKLYRFGTGRAWTGRVHVTSGRRFTWVYGSTLNVNPDRRRGDGETGWKALIHDMSHYIHRTMTTGFRPHSGEHARLEIRMVKEAIKRGWFGGALTPAEVPATPALDAGTILHRKLALVDAAIKRWETKAKRARTALRKLARRRAYYIRKGAS